MDDYNPLTIWSYRDTIDTGQNKSQVSLQIFYDVFVKDRDIRWNCNSRVVSAGQQVQHLSSIHKPSTLPC
jgi:hypothetical protein